MRKVDHFEACERSNFFLVGHGSYPLSFPNSAAPTILTSHVRVDQAKQILKLSLSSSENEIRALYLPYVSSSCSMRILDTGHCEHCGKAFGYFLINSGCGKTAELSVYDKRMPKLLRDCPPFREICVELEQYIQPCQSGGAFKKGATPRCPHYVQPLSAEAATALIEMNAPGVKKGWACQKNWHDTNCIVIENRLDSNNFRI